MTELKTKPTDLSVDAFLNDIVDEQKRRDSFAILDLMKQATHAEPKMWGESIVGLGDAHYRYESGREGDWFIGGFSPRKQNLTLYLPRSSENYPDLMQRLGKYKLGKSCLYIKKLADVDPEVLRELIQQSIMDRDEAAQ